jgi:hypothetical protein
MFSTVVPHLSSATPNPIHIIFKKQSHGRLLFVSVLLLAAVPSAGSRLGLRSKHDIARSTWIISRMFQFASARRPYLRVIRDLAVNFQWFVFIQKMNPHK